MISIDETEIVKRVPRKLTFVVVMALSLFAYAANTTDIDWRWVIGAFVIVVIAALVSHTILEWKNPTKENGTPTRFTVQSEAVGYTPPEKPEVPK